MLKSLREQALLIDDSFLSSGIKLIILPNQFQIQVPKIKNGKTKTKQKS